MAISGYTTCKTFSATKPYERERLGEAITAWLAAHPGLDVIETSVVQSSDCRFHATSIVLFLRELTPRPMGLPGREGE